MKRIATIDTKQDAEATAALADLKTYSRDTPKAIAPEGCPPAQSQVSFIVSFIDSASQPSYRQFDTPGERAEWIAQNAPHFQRPKLLEVPRMATSDEISLLIAARDL